MPRLKDPIIWILGPFRDATAWLRILQLTNNAPCWQLGSRRSSLGRETEDNEGYFVTPTLMKTQDYHMTLIRPIFSGWCNQNPRITKNGTQVLRLSRQWASPSKNRTSRQKGRTLNPRGFGLRVRGFGLRVSDLGIRLEGLGSISLVGFPWV